jgi:type VI secretion system protein ImpH
VSYRSRLSEEPFRFDFFSVLRELERSAAGKPKIGQSTVPEEDVVTLGQDPFLEFPASNVEAYRVGRHDIPNLKTRFLGFFGPQGALPLSTTIDAFNWTNQRDPSFARFADIFANRFQQLFFRAWADARPIAHLDRPASDRFFAYVGSMAGVGTPPYRNRDSIHDIAKVQFAGLVGAQVKSATRLKHFLKGAFRIDVDVVERIGSWLIFEPGDLTAVGVQGSTLGVDSFVGTRSYSINDKIRIRIVAETLEQYRNFLPSGSRFENLVDLVFFYIGHRCDFDVELALRAELAPAVQLGKSGELGWTSWISPKKPDADQTIYLSDARFSPMEQRRAAAKASAKREAGTRRARAGT